MRKAQHRQEEAAASRRVDDDHQRTGTVELATNLNLHCASAIFPRGPLRGSVGHRVSHLGGVRGVSRSAASPCPARSNPPSISLCWTVSFFTLHCALDVPSAGPLSGGERERELQGSWLRGSGLPRFEFCATRGGRAAPDCAAAPFGMVRESRKAAATKAGAPQDQAQHDELREKLFGQRRTVAHEPARGSRNAFRQAFSVLSAALVALACAAAILNRSVSEAYMDEPFHVGQTQAYCQGQWRAWDPKITTFPGLYASAAALFSALNLVGHAAGLGVPCSVAALRAVNLGFLGATFLLLAAYFGRRMAPRDAIGNAALLSLYPVHFFFHFLYYTDAGATCLIVAMLLAARSYRTQVPAALLGAAAIMFRQSNVVWVAFAMGDAVLRKLVEVQPQTARAVRRPALTLAGFRDVLLAAGSRPVWLLAQTWPYVGVIAAFAAFVVRNGGTLVLGDAEHHVPVLHLAMVGYLMVFVWAPYGMLGAGGLVSAATSRELRALVRPFRSALALLLAIAPVAHFASKYAYDHPFLLSDNRHYTFYVWRRLLGLGQPVRAAVAAFYTPLGILEWRRLAAANGAIWVLGFVVCAAAVLVPAHLLEPRYFTVPVIVYHMHAPPRSLRQVLPTVGLFAAANLALFYVFVSLPFRDAGGGLQRFMF